MPPLLSSGCLSNGWVRAGADGLSLNFIRWGHYFPRDFGRSHAPIMTAFLAEIRAPTTTTHPPASHRRTPLAVSLAARQTPAPPTTRPCAFV